MKILYPIVIFSLTVSLAQPVCAQKIFREGYIVKKNGESYTGLVETTGNQRIPSLCTFKRFDIATPVVYSPDEITAFGYRNGNRYESREIYGKTKFIEVIVAGKIVLYQIGNAYFIEKDRLGIVELKNGPIIYNTGNEAKKFSDLHEFLNFITEGRAVLNASSFDLKNDIIRVITSYNKESGKKYHVYNRSISEKQLSQNIWISGAAKSRIGVIAGANLYKLNMKFNPDMYGITSDNYYPVPPIETCLAAGFSYERLLLRSTDKISVKINLLYINQRFYSYSEKENKYGGITRDDSRFYFNGIKLPVLFQYSLTGRRIVPFLNAGAGYQLFLRSSYLHNAEVENSVHEIQTTVDKNMIYRNGEISAIGGLGTRIRIFRDLNMELMIMMEYGQGLFLNTDPTDTNYRTNKFYLQHSLQSTLLFGITF